MRDVFSQEGKSPVDYKGERQFSVLDAADELAKQAGKSLFPEQQKIIQSYTSWLEGATKRAETVTSFIAPTLFKSPKTTNKTSAQVMAKGVPTLIP